MYKEIEQHLISLADPTIAAQSQCFFKTEKGQYGHGDVFLGLRVPTLRAAVKQYKADISLSQIEKLLPSKYHEIRLFSLLLLVARFNIKDSTEQQEIVDLYLANTVYINNWDLVDSSAHHILGVYFLNRPKHILYELAHSNLLWERRIAIMTTLGFIKEKYYDDTLAIAKILLNDEQDLIHKAVGWMLREVGNRDRKTETDFLKQHYQIMPRTMLRYAIEKYDIVDRQAYLKGLV